MEDGVSELFDVRVIAGTRRPTATGFSRVTVEVE